jgi:hypothetical protein
MKEKERRNHIISYSVTPHKERKEKVKCHRRGKYPKPSTPNLLPSFISVYLQLQDVLCPVNPHHALNIRPTNGADLNLSSTPGTSAHVPAVVEQRILLSTIADLADIHLLVCNLPVRDALAVSLILLPATNVLVACLVFEEGALAVALALVEGARVSVA